MIDQSLAPVPPERTRTTLHHRVDYEFLGLLNEDFGIDFYSLNQAFIGVPAAPKKQAILEDLPEDHGLTERWAAVDVLATAANEANEEVGRYRRELGLRGPDPRA